jgi:hypothetical protein
MFPVVEVKFNLKEIRISRNHMIRWIILVHTMIKWKANSYLMPNKDNNNLQIRSLQLQLNKMYSKIINTMIIKNRYQNNRKFLLKKISRKNLNGLMIIKIKK